MRKPSNELLYNGDRYPIDEWLTLTAYAEKYQVSVKTLFSRIDRGSIPADSVLEVPEWGLRLIKDQPQEPPPRGPRGNRP